MPNRRGHCSAGAHAWSAGTWPQPTAVQVVDGSALRRPRGEASGHDDGEVVVQPEHPAVEQLVVQGAEGEPVVEVVRAAQLEPADMRGLDADDTSAGGAVE